MAHFIVNIIEIDKWKYSRRGGKIFAIVFRIVSSLLQHKTSAHWLYKCVHGEIDQANFDYLYTVGPVKKIKN